MCGENTHTHTQNKPQPYSPQASVTWAGVTSLQPEQPCVPRLDCGGAEGPREDGPANQPPLHLQSQVTWGWDHHLQIQAGHHTAQPSRVHPKPGGPYSCKSFDKSPGLQVSWCWVPRGSILPRNPPTYIRQYPQHCRVGRGWIFLGLKGKGEAAMRRQPLAVSSGTFHCKI